MSFLQRNVLLSWGQDHTNEYKWSPLATGQAIPEGDGGEVYHSGVDLPLYTSQVLGVYFSSTTWRVVVVSGEGYAFSELG